MAHRDATDISLLPENLLLHIFTFMSVKDRCSVRRVCRQWHRIMKDNTLWRQVDLRPYKLNLHRTWKVIRAHFSDVLQVLQVRGYMDPAGSNWKKSSMSDAMLKELRERCPNLTKLELRMTNLTDVSPDNVPTSLRMLTLHSSLVPASWFTHLGSAEKFTHLTTLDLTESTRTDNHALRSICNHGKLTRLCLAECYRINDEGLKVIGEKLSDLESLDVSGTGCSDLSLHIFARQLNKLHHLSLAKCKAVTDAGLACLVGMSSLESLNLWSVTSLTPMRVESLSKLSHLIFINVSDVSLTSSLQHLQKQLPTFGYELTEYKPLMSSC